MTQTQVKVAFDTGADPHDQDLYTYDGIGSGVTGFAAVTDADVEQFRREGWLVVHQAFTRRQVDDACEGLRDLINCRGKTSYQLMFEAAVRDRIDALTDDERQKAIRKVFNFASADERLDAVMLDPALLGVLSRLGLRNPTLYQAMALLKGPRGREKPWHQDRAYFDTPLEDRVIGVWIALDPATPENGCMHIMPGQHQPIIHWKRRDWQICDTDIKAMQDRRLAIPLNPGDLLLFDSMLPHGTPTNNTDMRRRALQYHYASANARTMPKEQRLDLFGSEGKDVTC